MTVGADVIRDEILRRVSERGAMKSICPSEVARALEPDETGWRRLMGPVRAVAVELAREGCLDVLRKGKAVDPEEEIRGVIRLRVRV